MQIKKFEKQQANLVQVLLKQPKSNDPFSRQWNTLLVHRNGNKLQIEKQLANYFKFLPNWLKRQRKYHSSRNHLWTSFFTVAALRTINFMTEQRYFENIFYSFHETDSNVSVRMSLNKTT